MSEYEVLKYEMPEYEVTKYEILLYDWPDLNTLIFNTLNLQISHEICVEDIFSRSCPIVK